jgi:oxygen-dependent protoporphyrinogen oxidase
VALDLVSRARAASEDESVAQFARRHFGREALDRLIQPLLGGIYTADVEELSVEAALPRFRHMERERGSLIRALWAQNRKKSNQPSSGPPHAPFAAPRDGMSSLLASLGDRLPWDGASLNAPVDQLVLRNDGQWQIAVGGREPRRILAQAVIVAAPAPESSRLLQKLDAPLARHLGEVAYAGCAIACLGYDRAQITHPLNGGGFVVPLVEQRLILCCSFSSQKYSRRAPEGAVLLRVFMGGACQSGLLALADADLLQLAEREIGELLGIRGEPVVRRLVRHRRAMPQYHVGHLRRVAAIEQRAARFPRLRLAGSAYRGVGVPACIQSGYDAADSLIQELQGSSTFRATKEPAQFA